MEGRKSRTEKNEKMSANRYTKNQYKQTKNKNISNRTETKSNIYI
jgi:hypothetical protein